MPADSTRPVLDQSVCFAALADQFVRSWLMLRDAVERFPAEQWYAETCPDMAPARRAYHLVYWADAYSRRSVPEVGDVPDPDDPDISRLPDQAGLLAYAERTAARIDDLLRGGSAARLLAPYRTRRTGACLYERLIYVLRHNLQHYGELQTLLRLQGLEPGGWR